jgi:hypothetical protein
LLGSSPFFVYSIVHFFFLLDLSDKSWEKMNRLSDIVLANPKKRVI